MTDPRRPSPPADAQAANEPPPGAGKRFNPWPWVPVVILGTVVLANVWMIWAATTIQDGLLYDDYYERALNYDPPEATAAEGADADGDDSAE